MLDKRLTLGGLQVGGPRTMQNPARFRVANNVYQSLDDLIIPRFGNKPYLSSFAADEIVIAVTGYKLKPFIISRTANDVLHFYYDSATELPSQNLPFLVNPNDSDLISLGIQFSEIKGCLYFNIPILGLFKFDGIQVYRAGVPTPSITSDQFDAAGTTWVRVIGHHVDFQGNQVNSGYVQFRVTPSSGNAVINSDFTVSEYLSGVVSPAEVEPGQRQVFDNMGAGHDTFNLAAGAVDSSDANGVTYTTSGAHAVKVGCYVMTSAVYESAASPSGFGVDTYGKAFKVSAFTATTVTLQYADAKYLDVSRNWVTIQATAGLPAGAFVGTNQWLSVWTSNAATGNYVWKDLIPAPFSTIFASTVDVSSPTVPATGSDKLAFNLSGNLGDIYDVTTVKFPFPSFEALRPSFSFCTYGELAILGQVTDIYFSDSSLGGSFEMTTGLSFITVGGGNDGPLQTVQATSEFLFVSRQFKNYYVSGNLPTANYRVQPISNSLGAYSNEAAIACQNSVLYVNKTGIWVVSIGGRCDEASASIKGLFETFSKTKPQPEEAYWEFNDTFPTYITYTQFAEGITAFAYNKWVRVRYDNCRNLVFIAIPGSDKKGNILVLNMNNGEFYTWNDLLYNVTAPDFKDFCAIEGSYYVTVNGSAGNKVNKEEKSDLTYKYNYMAGSYKPTLVGVWFTAGEPSLEKKINQIKLWGNIEGTLSLSQYVDWSSTVAVVGDYTNATADLFSHKKRLNPANALSVSVKIEVNCTRFELDGLELEFSPFQEGMKR